MCTCLRVRVHIGVCVQYSNYACLYVDKEAGEAMWWHRPWRGADRVEKELIEVVKVEVTVLRSLIAPRLYRSLRRLEQKRCAPYEWPTGAPRL